ncbi:MAG TPA: CocE/NonD family hydrolase [Kofleriaceae bacterium]|jgi:putative CocE/NonD family hydrolase
MRANLLQVVYLVVLCGAVARASHAQTPSAKDLGDRIPVQISWDHKIAMRDGVRLSATIYRDLKQDKRLPAIVTMTPYIAEHTAPQGVYFAQNGYVFIAVDARGRGNSEGTFLPGQIEARDGYDVIEWAARQPWCDGQVATWGGSWLGFTQWSIAKEFPPHLKAMAPTAAVHPGVDYPQRFGIFGSYMLRWLTYVHGRALNRGLFEADALWFNAVREQVTTGRAFQDLEDITGVHGTVFRTWLAHPREDAFWQALTPRPEHYAKLRIPILTITGHYDADQLGALTYYERHMAYGNKEATARHWLVIGPWDHGGTRRPKAELGGLNFGPDAAISMEALHRAWYDHVLKGAPPPAFLKDRVACFLLGRNAWIYASELKQIEGPATRFDLDVTGAAAGDVTRSGRLLAQAPDAPASVVLVSDPRYLPPRDSDDAESAAFLKDQRSAYTNQPSQLVWHSAPFADETVLAGRPRLQLQIASDQPDSDLFAELYEVQANGSAVLLASSAVRLRYRRGGTAAAMMVPGQPERVAFPAMSFFARAIAKGSRLRLIVDAGPRYASPQRNSHTGGDLASEPIAKARIAKITVMTGPNSGSALELPHPDEALLSRKD